MPYAKLSKHGYSQEVRLPKEFRMPGTRVKVSHHKRGILLEPVDDGYKDFLEAIEMFSDDFMSEPRQELPYDKREDLFS